MSTGERRKTLLKLFGFVAALVVVFGGISPAAAFTVNEVEPNNTVDTAQNIDSNFSLDFDANIGDTTSNTSTTIPHVTINGTGDGTFDFYSFTVFNTGDKAIFDIDFGSTVSGTTGRVDTLLRLFDSGGTELADNDDNSISFGQGGSVSRRDSYLEFTFSAPGTFVIGVEKCCEDPDPVPVPSGATYQLQVSLENAATAFDPFTVGKAEIRFDDNPPKEKFKVKGAFTLGSNSDGIDPVNEGVVVGVGPSSIAIPAGSFMVKGNKFEFKGVVGDIDVKMKIKEVDIGVYEFEVKADGVDLTGTINPMDVSLAIGDDFGTTSVSLEGKLKFKAQR